ncbi:MAG: hypothetical protein EBT20_18605 [Alphaproteobacteria bacterium]|nr:hypothetical protein [Alphaproteobacteria bacterium]
MAFQMSIPLHDRIYRVILPRTLFSSVNIWLVLSIFLLIGCLFPAHADESKTIKLTDPVYPDKPKKKHTLNVHFDTQGFPSGYSMELVNKVCLDDVCKLVEVTMYWDVIGFYQSLEYPEGKPLTKVEHEPFTPEDYDKLDSILKDRESILDNHELGFLATENDDKSSEEGYADGQDSDGVSKATPGAVKEAVVKDAAWTTWVLWKYANTELVTIMTLWLESGAEKSTFVRTRRNPSVTGETGFSNVVKLVLIVRPSTLTNSVKCLAKESIKTNIKYADEASKITK